LVTPTIEHIHEYIQQHLHEPLTAAENTATVQLLPDYLNRIFKHGTGTSLMSYVTRLRMESAQLLLRSSELSVQEIGYSPLKFRR